MKETKNTSDELVWEDELNNENQPPSSMEQRVKLYTALGASAIGAGAVGIAAGAAKLRTYQYDHYADRGEYGLSGSGYVFEDLVHDALRKNPNLKVDPVGRDCKKNGADFRVTDKTTGETTYLQCKLTNPAYAYDHLYEDGKYRYDGQVIMVAPGDAGPTLDSLVRNKVAPSDLPTVIEANTPTRRDIQGNLTARSSASFRVDCKRAAGVAMIAGGVVGVAGAAYSGIRYAASDHSRVEKDKLVRNLKISALSAGVAFVCGAGSFLAGSFRKRPAINN